MIRAALSSGRNSEICAAEEILSPCLEKPEFACYTDPTCKVQASGDCGWTLTPNLKSYILDTRSGTALADL